MYNIYTLTDPRTGELMYVGQTVQELNSRLVGHLHEAYHRKRTLEKKQEWVKSMIEAGLLPVISLLEQTEDLSREMYWIQHYNPPLNLVGNKSELLSRFLRKCKAIPVYQYDLQGNYVGEWYSLMEASRNLGIEPTNISASTRGKRKLAGPYQWRKFKAESIPPYYFERGKIEVHQYDLDGKYVMSAPSARDVPGVRHQSIFRCCSGKLKTAQGMRYSYEKVDQLPPLVKAPRCDIGRKYGPRKPRYSLNLGETQDGSQEVVPPQQMAA